MVLQLLPTVMLLASPTFAEVPASCELDKPPYEQVLPLSGRRGRTYWGQTFEYPEGSGKYFLTSTEQGGCDGDNTMIDLQTGAVLPGGTYDCDPFPSPDGRILTHPGKHGVKVWSIKDIMEGRGPNSLPAPREIGPEGMYQSVGLFDRRSSSINASRKYRIITWDEMNFQDVQMTAQGNRITLKPIGYQRQACSNLRDLDRSTPIISKDAKFVAVGSGSGTLVLKLSEDGTSCSVKHRVGRSTSKANFSYDSKYLGFQAAKQAESPTDMNVYETGFVRDLSNGEEFEIVPNISPGTKVGYPTFTKDGRVLVQVISKDPETGEQKRALHLIKIDELKSWHKTRIARQAATATKVQQFAQTCSESTDVLAKIADQWSKICKTQIQSSNRPLEILAGLDEAKCRALVTQYWDGVAGSSPKYKKEDLLALCASPAGQPATPGSAQ